ncbi:MAG: prolyl oligopeptidase family serine peptidase [Planctomycetota bacterium]|jgi:hypothetical protein
MKRAFITCSLLLCPALLSPAGEIAVTGIKAEHRGGQTFITWKDAAGGEAAAKYRYNVYRSDGPITAANLAGAELVARSVLHNSGMMFGWAWMPAERLKTDVPMRPFKEGGEPLPRWSGMTAVTVTAKRKSYYAVVATEAGKPVSKVVPGKSATTEALDEGPGEIQPMKIWDSKERKGPYIKQTCISGKQKLPMMVNIHASGGYKHSGKATYGDYYQYFARPEWGWRDGLPGVFAVRERRYKPGNRLELDCTDAILRPESGKYMQTLWFGYVCVPDWAKHKDPRAYNFTEKRVLWIADWVTKKYEADPERLYCTGGSMGAWGSMTFAIRHPEVFAAVYPNRPRTIQKGRASMVKLPSRNAKTPMADGETDFFDRMNMPRFVKSHPGDLPFIAWCCGRRDGFATWKEQIDMVKALTEAKHAFAFAWNNGNHSSGGHPMREVNKYYAWHLFARNRSYPAFGNSSINGNMGNGDPKDGDLGNDNKKNGPLQVFGINLGFKWQGVVDEAGKWSAKITNDLCKADMTVDVTPRRCQQFKPKPGESFKWSSSTGGSGTVKADANGLVTVEKLVIKPGAATTLTITK